MWVHAVPGCLQSWDLAYACGVPAEEEPEQDGDAGGRHTMRGAT